MHARRDDSDQQIAMNAGDLLTTARLWLRPAVVEDASRLAQLVSAGVSRWVASWPFPLSEEEAAKRIADARKAAALGLALPYVIGTKEQNQVIGWAGITQVAPGEPKAALGYWLGERHHGRGYMTEAGRALVAEAFRAMLLETLEAAVQPGNIASMAVLQACGMHEVGRRMVYAPSRGRDELCVIYEMQRPRSFG